MYCVSMLMLGVGMKMKITPRLRASPNCKYLHIYRGFGDSDEVVVTLFTHFFGIVMIQ